ncbi:40317_t:CDS:1, partial [Gigaspora margarita]
MVGCWVKALSQVPYPSHSQKNTRSIGSERRAFFSEEEAQLYEWIMMVRQNSLAVNYPNIKSKMAEILDKSAKKTKDRSKKLAID